MRRVGKWKDRLRPLLVCCVLLLGDCGKQPPATDHPRLTPAVVMRDVVFHSTSLHREMQYRVVFPGSAQATQKFEVVYLLHGGDGNFRDWTNYSDVAIFAEHGLMLVMPEGDNSYYTNSAEKPQDRYEDYIIKDLILDVETRFPACDRSRRAIVGLSMGGFGAVKIALHRPEMFLFVGALSLALDVPSRPFSIKRVRQWRFHRSIFGPWGGKTQNENDPFVLVRAADPKQVPYILLTCGEQEGLIQANRRFAKLLQERNFRYQFQAGQGGHDWNQWNRRLGTVFDQLREHMPATANVP